MEIHWVEFHVTFTSTEDCSNMNKKRLKIQACSNLNYDETKQRCRGVKTGIWKPFSEKRGRNMDFRAADRGFHSDVDGA